MERYFIVMIALTLVGITVKAGNEFLEHPAGRKKMIAAVTAFENNADYADILSPYTKFKTSPEVGYEKKIYDATANKNGIQKIAKAWRQG